MDSFDRGAGINLILAGILLHANCLICSLICIFFSFMSFVLSCILFI